MYDHASKPKKNRNRAVSYSSERNCDNIIQEPEIKYKGREVCGQHVLKRESLKKINSPNTLTRKNCPSKIDRIESSNRMVAQRSQLKRQFRMPIYENIQKKNSGLRPSFIIQTKPKEKKDGSKKDGGNEVGYNDPFEKLHEFKLYDEAGVDEELNELEKSIEEEEGGHLIKEKGVEKKGNLTHTKKNRKNKFKQFFEKLKKSLGGRKYRKKLRRKNFKNKLKEIRGQIEGEVKEEYEKEKDRNLQEIFSKFEEKFEGEYKKEGEKIFERVFEEQIKTQDKIEFEKEVDSELRELEIEVEAEKELEKKIETRYKDELRKMMENAGKEERIFYEEIEEEESQKMKLEIELERLEQEVENE